MKIMELTGTALHLALRLQTIGVGDVGQGGAVASPLQIRAKPIFSGKNRVKFRHFVNFFGHISCKIREFC